MSWILLWKVLFVVVMLVFAVMTFLVTVLGARDIKKLLRALGKQGESSQDGSKDGQGEVGREED